MLKVIYRPELGGGRACGGWGRSRLLNLDAGMAAAFYYVIQGPARSLPLPTSALLGRGNFLDIEGLLFPGWTRGNPGKY